ncbi:MAG: GlsB/YeaQ/YmgE family stress response membrane protein [Deltaproteobacteria bacterium]|nr:GlsB/YeaQ/YmgE family stress response membrane protein [Deltaproteobacteria bacterium]
MHILYMLVIGLVIGALAKLVMPGRDPGGIIITMLIGIAGSMIAGFIGREMHWYRHDEPAGFLASIGGALLLLFAYRVVLRNRPS